MTHRSAQNIGCSASMPSRTPACCATGTRSPIASAIIRRASARSRLPGTRPPDTRISASAPSAAASATAARLSAAAAARRSASAWVKKPPRHRLETWTARGARGRGRVGQAELGDLVPPQADRRDVVPYAQVDRLGGREVLHRCLVEREPAEPDQPGPVVICHGMPWSSGRRGHRDTGPARAPPRETPSSWLRPGPDRAAPWRPRRARRRRSGARLSAGAEGRPASRSAAADHSARPGTPRRPCSHRSARRRSARLSGTVGPIAAS